MRLLFDTCALLWWMEESPRLSSDAYAAIADGENTVYVSAVTAVEIAVKASLGKLKVPPDLDTQIEANDFTQLPLTIRHGQRMLGLPWHHRDPFDRMLIAQAQEEGLTVITVDHAFAAYGINVLDS